jgi:hypothetical protein
MKKTGHVRINITLRRVRITTLTVEKAVSIAYSECVSVASVIQQAERMRRVIAICGRSGSDIFLHIIL